MRYLIPVCLLLLSGCVSEFSMWYGFPTTVGFTMKFDTTPKVMPTTQPTTTAATQGAK